MIESTSWNEGHPPRDGLFIYYIIKKYIIFVNFVHFSVSFY